MKTIHALSALILVKLKLCVGDTKKQEYLYTRILILLYICTFTCTSFIRL